MLSKYAQVVTDEMHDVQVRWFASCGLGVGQNLLVEKALTVQVQSSQRITGERGRIRTCDPCLKRALLYHLSYAPTLQSKALTAVISDARERMGTIIWITLRCASRFTGMSP